VVLTRFLPEVTPFVSIPPSEILIHDRWYASSVWNCVISDTFALLLSTEVSPPPRGSKISPNQGSFPGSPPNCTHHSRPPFRKDGLKTDRSVYYMMTVDRYVCLCQGDFDESKQSIRSAGENSAGRRPTLLRGGEECSAGLRRRFCSSRPPRQYSRAFRAHALNAADDWLSFEVNNFNHKRSWSVCVDAVGVTAW
jgi:hypothetical protein